LAFVGINKKLRLIAEAEILSQLFFVRASWITFFSYWFYNRNKTKSTASRESKLKQGAHLLAMVSGFAFVLTGDIWPDFLDAPIYPKNQLMIVIGSCISILAVCFAIWARRTLGMNWSAAVSLKKEHELIRTGPYRYFRHPIYTGILSNVVGSALVTGEVRSLAAVILVAGAYFVKIRREEKLLSTHFPSEYPEYSKHTWRIYPFL